MQTRCSPRETRSSIYPRLSTEAIIQETRRRDFYTTAALDFDFDAHAGEPAEWLKFLSQLWTDDPASVATLQEWIGYLLTLDTRQEKILLLIGPKRSGKGTIARVISRIGRQR